MWSFKTAGQSPSTPSIAGELVYFSDSWYEAPPGERHLYVLDALSGQEVWTFSANSTLMQAPAPGDGVIYVPLAGEILALEAAQ